MEVHCDEGVAIHIGPEPCVVDREVKGEASAGERTGQPSSRERIIPDADTVHWVEGNTDGHVSASARTIRRGRRPWHVHKHLAREPGGLTRGRDAPRSASGRRGAEADDARA